MSYYSKHILTGDGTTTVFTLPFSYLLPQDVSAYVNNVSVPFIWTGSNTIKFSTPPPNGSVIEIKRNTELLNPLVNYQAGTLVRAEDMNRSNRQNLYTVQEVRDDMEWEFEKVYGDIAWLLEDLNNKFHSLSEELNNRFKWFSPPIILSGVFNGSTGTTLNLPTVVTDPLNYSVTVIPLTNSPSVGTVWCTKTTTSFTVHCSGGNVGGPFEATVVYIDSSQGQRFLLNLASLKLVNPATLPYVNVLGFTSPGDKGGGEYVWSATALKSEHNGGTIIDPSHSADPGTAGWYAPENDGVGCFVLKGDSRAEAFGFIPGVHGIGHRLQAAVNAGPCLIGEGQFYLNQPITVTSSQLVGIKDKTILTSTYTPIESAEYLILLAGTNSRLKDLHIDGASKNYYGPTFDSTSVGATIEGVSLQNFNYASIFAISGAIGGNVLRCRITSGGGIRIPGGFDFIVSQNRVSGTNSKGIALVPCTNSIVQENVITNTLIPAGDGIYVAYGASGVVVSDNVVYSVGGNGIKLSKGAHHVVVSNNSVENTGRLATSGYGIRLQGNRYTSVIGNRIYQDSGPHANNGGIEISPHPGEGTIPYEHTFYVKAAENIIQLEGEQVGIRADGVAGEGLGNYYMINNNIVRGGNVGIAFADNITHLTISGNFLTVNKYGISCSTQVGNYTQIIDNVIVASSSRGISAVQSSTSPNAEYCSISRNVVKDWTDYGIMLTRLGNSEIQGNITTKSGTGGVGIYLGVNDFTRVEGNRCTGGDEAMRILGATTRGYAKNNYYGSLPSSFGAKVITGLRRGTGSINAGEQSVSITHGFGVTPDISQISITPTSSFGEAGVTSFWISDVGATTFQVNVNAGTTGAFNFSWIVNDDSNY